MRLLAHRLSAAHLGISSSAALAFAIAGCSANTQSNQFHRDGGGAGSPPVAVPDGGEAPPPPPPTGTGGSGGGLGLEGGTPTGPSAPGDPETCEIAAKARSYVGCDFWPTVVANSVWSIFDYTVVVANAGTNPAEVTVTRGGSAVATVTVDPNSLQKIYLPWVPELKGPDVDACGAAQPIGSSTVAAGGAYHLVASSPVTVYQFNALEYKGAGGPAGKDWSSCPGNQVCKLSGAPSGCFSFTNDASLLLPTPTLTGNYRVTTVHGNASMAGYFSITATADGTDVTVKVSPASKVMAGPGVTATDAGGILHLSLDSGDVAQIVGAPGVTSDLSGTVVQATKPVQIIGGIPCIAVPGTPPPFGQPPYTCDHVEESVFPAETWGKHYVVTAPTGPNGAQASHYVRIFGNVDGTTLTYPSGAPSGAPTTIDAGKVVELSATQDFEVEGDHEFAVGLLMPSGEVLDPSAASGSQKGDPSLSLATAVEQYRTKYVFLAPDDYDVSFLDVVLPAGTNLQIDGAPMTATPRALGGGSYSVARVALGPGIAGAHVLSADHPVGIQVIGYGSYTSYQYPAGLNLTVIAPPPPPVK